MTDLRRAIAAGRDLHHDPEVTYSAYWFNEYRSRMGNLLAAFDAARSQAARVDVRFKRDLPFWSNWCEDKDPEGWAAELRGRGFEVEVRYLYAAPPADEALADTQRAIIEAAERRGYERGLKEAKPTLQAELDHARRRIGELTIQLGEAMKVPPAALAAPAPKPSECAVYPVPDGAATVSITVGGSGGGGADGKAQQPAERKGE